MSPEPSDASRLRVPDVFVGLQLQTNGESVGEYPSGEVLRIENAVHRGKGARRAAADQLTLLDDAPGEFVVCRILDHELHFVGEAQAIQVGPVHLVRLAAAWTLHVDDAEDARGHLLDAD